MNTVDENTTTDGFNVYFSNPITQLNVNQVRKILKTLLLEERRSNLNTYSYESYDMDNPDSRRNWENRAFEFAENLHPDVAWFVIAPNDNGEFYIYCNDIKIGEGDYYHSYLPEYCNGQMPELLDIEKPKFDYNWRTYKIYRDLK